MNFQRLLPWSGPVMIIVMFAGMIIAGLVPPPTPEASQEEVLAFYSNNPVRVRLGTLLVLSGAALLIPWSAILAEQTKTIPGISPALIYTQFGAGVANCLLILIPMLFFAIAAYRPGENADITFMLNDFAWITFIMPYSCGLLQFSALGLAILSDKRAQPAFPRWSGYLNLFVAIGLTPSGLLTFFKAGPFAWSGLFAYWIPFTVFFIMFVSMFVLLQRLAKRQELGQL